MSANFDSTVKKTVDAVLTPTQRLDLSRARMRVFLDRRKPANDAGGGLGTGDVGAKVSAWADDLRANPLVGAVIDAVHGWWTTHPLHSVALMAGDAVEDIAVPWIRRYPLAVVGGALAAGVVVSKIKPWRWLGRPALFAGLTSQIAAQLMTHAPLEFVLDAFTKFAKPKRPMATSDGVAAAAAAAAAVDDSLDTGLEPVATVVTPPVVHVAPVLTPDTVPAR